MLTTRNVLSFVIWVTCIALVLMEARLATQDIIRVATLTGWDAMTWGVIVAINGLCATVISVAIIWPLRDLRKE